MANNLDLERGKEDLSLRFPYLEGDADTQGDMLQCLERAEEPRFIKTHIPFSLLPSDLLSTAKVVYVARNPKDTMVSYFHHHKLFKRINFIGDLKSFSKRFQKGQVNNSPYFQHVEEAWKLKSHPNLLFLFYEDIIRDMKNIVKKVSNFLGCEMNETKMQQLVEHLDIKKFRNNAAVNRKSIQHLDRQNEGAGSFIRKGEAGGWREEFKDNPELEVSFDQWIEKQRDHYQCTIEFCK